MLACLEQENVSSWMIGILRDAGTSEERLKLGRTPTTGSNPRPTLKRSSGVLAAP